MFRLRASTILFAAALTGSAFAGYDFNYSNSDTRTVFQDLSGVGVGGEGWDTQVNTDAGDPDLFLNSVNILTTPGFDSNIHFQPTPTSFSYYDYNAGMNSTYTLGTAIGGGSFWSLRQLVSLDVFNSTSAATGTYDFSVQLVGGADASATDVLKTFDLHVEVYNKLDLSVSGTATDISGPGDKAHVTMSVLNNMDEDFVSTTWFSSIPGYAIDRSDPASPTLDLQFTGDWFNKSVAPGDTRTDAHSDWSINPTSTVGTYQGSLGVVGGLHSGDFYFVNMQNVPDIHVQSVPEPASMVALGVGALGLLRRRRKA